jgi:hypothetical protein
MKTEFAINQTGFRIQAWSDEFWGFLKNKQSDEFCTDQRRVR